MSSEKAKFNSIKLTMNSGVPLLSIILHINNLPKYIKNVKIVYSDYISFHFSKENI